jgi:hypothetical protein
LQEKLPSPGTIETQIARVDMHRRSISGESGYLGDQPDVSVPQLLDASHSLLHDVTDAIKLQPSCP